ncbi:hypothetical protein [Sphaerisporangium fuscum]|uniref:hypothetical protein n=1 Tax=Sphaerisporangium fuscum TaxID=2835868 RepID=UPI001BDDAF9F|nr:hypothetical protein [Sphaerisporangium fuscum]
MGVFYDYYRADDREAALAHPESPREVAVPGFDVVVTKWIDPHVVLARLVAFVADVEFSPGLVDTAILYPPPEGAPRSDEEWDALPEGSPYLEGPCIGELTVDVRDVLAGADDERLPLIAERWSKIEEFSSFGPDDEGYTPALVKDLVGLARRAKANGQMLYCWSSL